MSVKKNRYLRLGQIALFPKLHKLCVTISTSVTNVDEKFSRCVWGVAYKAPGDQFSKAAARDAVDKNVATGLPHLTGSFDLLNGEYTHQEIIDKIICQIAVHDAHLSSDYIDFFTIRSLYPELQFIE
jgi:hypothetical protein